MDVALFPRGAVLGFSIAAVVGPIGLLCIRRTLSAGFAVGFVSGLGAATADATYAAIAGFGVSALAAVLVDQRVWLRLVGGIFLVYLAMRTLRAAPAERSAGPTASGMGLAAAYSSTLVLTLSNPMTILSFAGIFAGLGLGDVSPASDASAATSSTALGGTSSIASAAMSSIAIATVTSSSLASVASSSLASAASSSIQSAVDLVLGVFVGSAAWWLILASLVAQLRRRVTPPWLRRVNVASGLVILGFGVQSLIAAGFAS
jgi:threonine/homoserine/homoserine lactone efflux protein